MVKMVTKEQNTVQVTFKTRLACSNFTLHTNMQKQALKCNVCINHVIDFITFCTYLNTLTTQSYIACKPIC